MLLKVDSTVKQIDLSPPDLYFLYFYVLTLCLYASGLTHLTMAVHVPFIKDRGNCTAASVCHCLACEERTKIGSASATGLYELCIQSRGYEI